MAARLLSSTPPRARLAIRVGIVGHRPNRLDQADLEKLSSLLGSVLARVRAAVQAFAATASGRTLYANEPPVLRAVSPLAEGSDRLFAEQALALGYALACPLPFAQAEFEKDFTGANALEPDSLAHFRRLLARAREQDALAIFELDGTRDDAAAAYAAAGRVVLNQSDLLIVIWDGDQEEKKGGTLHTLREAIAYQVPVLWIDAVAPHPWQVLRAEADLDCLASGGRCAPRTVTENSWRELDAVVTATLDWPAEETASAPHGAAAGPGDLRSVFFDEPRPRWNGAIFWKLFRTLLGDGRLRVPRIRLPEIEPSVLEDWPTRDDRAAAPGAGAAAGETVSEWVNARLRPHYAWPDKLADFYADKYRSAFLLVYGFAALAVFLALWPLVISDANIVASFTLAATELGVVGIILLLFFVGRRLRWHDRWMEYRLLAEVIRQLRFLVPLGGGRPFIRFPAHLETYGEPARTWMFAHVRGIARFTGLPHARVDGAYLQECIAYLLRVVKSQESFHRNNERRSERIERMLHGIAMGLIVLTIIAIVLHLLHLAPHLFHVHWAWLDAINQYEPWLTVATAGFPALGAALAGINNQGEFGRVAKRSQAMAERMARLAEEIRGLQDRSAGGAGALRLEHITPIALRVAQLMVEEVSDWRVVFLDRPAALPA